MRPTNDPPSQTLDQAAGPAARRRSFIEEARRRQIVDTAIRTIAEKGITQTTLAEIARECGISKGVISYHFDGKDELIAEVLSNLVRAPAEFVKDRVEAVEGALARLREYVAASVEYMARNRGDYVALVDLWGSAGSTEGRQRFNHEAHEPARRYVMKLLEAGVKSGEFREVPVRTVASTIQAAIDGLMLQWVFEPEGIDLATCRDEILSMVTNHLAANGAGSNGATRATATTTKRRGRA